MHGLRSRLRRSRLAMGKRISQCRVPNERRRIVVIVLPAVFSMCINAYMARPTGGAAGKRDYAACIGCSLGAIRRKHATAELSSNTGTDYAARVRERCQDRPSRKCCRAKVATINRGVMGSDLKAIGRRGWFCALASRRSTQNHANPGRQRFLQRAVRRTRLVSCCFPSGSVLQRKQGSHNFRAERENSAIAVRKYAWTCTPNRMTGRAKLDAITSNSARNGRPT